MKIVRIIARLNVGGPARHVVWLTKELQDEEFQSVLLTGTVPAGEEDMSWFAAENGVEPVFIAEMSRELSPKDIVSLWKVFRLIRREKPDIIHTHTAKAGTIGRVAGLYLSLADVANFYRQAAPRQIYSHLSRARFSQLLRQSENKDFSYLSKKFWLAWRRIKSSLSAGSNLTKFTENSASDAKDSLK